MAKEIELEIFRVGGSASRHVKAEHIAEVAAQDFSNDPAPICFGHPKSDTPAAGQIVGLRADGNSLFAKVKSFSDSAIEGIKKGQWINRSAAFFDPTHEANPRPGKWSFRHLGLLGGAAPGIPGMGTLQKALAFDAAEDAVTVDGDPADALIYVGKPTPVHFVSSEEVPTVTEFTAEQKAENERLAAADAAMKKREDEFEARVKSQFEAANGGMVDSLVASTKVLPAEVPALKAVFNALDRDEIEFGAADKSDKSTASAKLFAFLASALPKRVPVDDRLSPATAFDAATDGETYQDKSAGLTGKAKALMEKNPGLSFEAAIERASSGGNVL